MRAKNIVLTAVLTFVHFAERAFADDVLEGDLVGRNFDARDQLLDRHTVL